ncbi:amine dehydrogenase large subunit [Paracoccus sp. (in: a-proteobacteria)]|uniref:amine dehydrogenase large subunit n=1 Tax=Paracoccus sp. TaxID=267 RepID=UPI003A892EBF
MKHHLILTLSVLVASGNPALSQGTEIEPETLTVEERIPEGDHLFVLDFGMTGSSVIYVLNAEDLALVGSIGFGSMGQMAMSPDNSKLYTASGYMRRYTYGELEAVIHEWDAATLNANTEMLISPKFAPALSQNGIFNLSADGAYMVVQNATPATSVNIVDLAKGGDLVEIPTPGCWTAYPSTEGHAFSTLCGDGTVTKYSYEADGTVSDGVKSEKIFDADSNPVFGVAVRAQGKLVYVTFGGSLLFVDDSGDVPVLERTAEFASDGWAPGGNNMIAYHAPSNTLFVGMHPNAFDGSHKFPAEEIWAIDLESGTVVARGKANADTNLAVSGGDTPVLFGVDHMGGVHRYDVTLGEGAAITTAASREGVALFATKLATDF